MGVEILRKGRRVEIEGSARAKGSIKRSFPCAPSRGQLIVTDR